MGLGREVKNTCINRSINKHTLFNNKAFIYRARDSQNQANTVMQETQKKQKEEGKALAAEQTSC